MWTWKQSPELMARLTAAQNALTTPIDIMTYAGFCGSEEALRKHVERYETQVREQAIAADLALCDLGEVLTKGAAKRRFKKHRKACFAELHRMNEADGLNKLTDDEILAELELT